MVYCNLKEKRSGSAIYLFGTTTADITGEVEFFVEYRKPNLLKQPAKASVSETVLFPLVAKYKKKFSNGIFPEKISHEY